MFFTAAQNVCFWHKADMPVALKRTSMSPKPMSVFDPKRTLEIVVLSSTEPFLDVQLTAIWIVPDSGEKMT
jgi:hypothetical protein